ncbi:MAG: CHRD domain-containing protein [Actinomycetota bacterium]|nr:CHRD domain-containing protein [Actinomycetota bacterium]
MSPWGDDNHNVDRRQLLDDATAEDLVAGRSKAGRGELGHLSALLEEVRSLGGGPAPPASPTLARILAGHRATGDGTEAAPVTRRRRLVAFLTPGPVRSRWADDGLVVKAALVLLVAAASLTAAGAARLLPFELSGNGNVPPTPGRPPDTLRPDGTVPPVPAGPAQGQGEPPSSPTAGHPGGTDPPLPSIPTDRGDGSTVPEPPSSDLGSARWRRPSDPPGSSAAAPDTAKLSGGSVTPDSGDPDGGGIASVSLDSDRGLLCLTLRVTGIAPVSSVDLHEASYAAGPPVVSLGPNELTGCVPVDAKMLAKIDRKPAAYSVDVHTDEFPGGALRGQLSR